MSLPRASKRAAKAAKMKQASAKKKKLSMSKSMEDSISETISFVIKGKLTPIKPTFIPKTGRVVKKEPKNKATKKKIIKIDKPLDIRNTSGKEDKSSLVSKEQKFKKIKQEEVEIKQESDTRIKPTKKQSTLQKSQKKEAPDCVSVTNEPKKETNKSVTNICKKESVKKPEKENNVKKRLKVNEKKSPVVKPQKVVKSNPKQKKPSAKEKKTETPEKKSKKTVDNKKQTIAKLIKQANKDLKECQLKVPEVNCKGSANDSKEDKDSAKTTKPEAPLDRKEIKKSTKTIAAKVLKPKIKEEPAKTEPTIKKKVALKQELKDVQKKPAKKKIKTDDSNLSTDDTSDELTLDLLRQQSVDDKIKLEPEKQIEEEPLKTSKKVKVEQESDVEKKPKNVSKEKVVAKKGKKKAVVKPKMVIIKKRVLTPTKDKTKLKNDQRSRKMKLFGFWNGPKRHRVASLNALAKVHCLYENESRGNILDNIPPIKKEVKEKKPTEVEKETVPMMTLRSAPGLRAVGKHWDMHDSTSSSSEDNSSDTESVPETSPIEIKTEKEEKLNDEKKPPVKRKRNRSELIMDLKDMVVRKRMASLNASAILAASYCVEKRSLRSPRNDQEDTTDSDDSDDTYVDESIKRKPSEEDLKKEEDRKVIEVCATPNKKVAVIVNQDTDVTITGVYVNSTTRSTHHEGYCSIAGMQYRISATSHTQTAATAVATETILQSASSSSQENVSCYLFSFIFSSICYSKFTLRIFKVFPLNMLYVSQDNLLLVEFI